VSVLQLVEVSCDGRPLDSGGIEDCPDSSGWSGYGTAAELRARMRDDGWAVGLPGGFDRCPNCRDDQ
jgi:hypothetical protein